MLLERLCPRDGLYAFASLRGSYEKSDERNARCYLKVSLARVSDDDDDDDVDVAIDVHLADDDNNDDDNAAKEVIQSSTSLPRGNQVDGLPRVCSCFVLLPCGGMGEELLAVVASKVHSAERF